MKILNWTVLDSHETKDWLLRIHQGARNKMTYLTNHPNHLCFHQRYLLVVLNQSLDQWRLYLELFSPQRVYHSTYEILQLKNNKTKFNNWEIKRRKNDRYLKNITADFVNWVVIVKFYKTKTSFFAGFFFGDYRNWNYIAISRKIIFHIILGNIIFDTSNEYFFDSTVRFRITYFLQHTRKLDKKSRFNTSN